MGNTSPKGIWSDGTTMWVSDNDDDRLYAYNMPPSASLKSLELTGADIGAFQTSMTDYAARVPATTASTTVTAAAATAGATVTIAPADADAQTAGHQVSLAEGDNTVTVTVANGADTRTYTAVITRIGSTALSSDATLSALSLTGVDIGAFSSTTTDYTAYVANAFTDTDLTAVATDEYAFVTISPADIHTGAASHQARLRRGENVLVVTVVSADRSNETRYTVRVIRARN